MLILPTHRGSCWCGGDLIGERSGVLTKCFRCGRLIRHIDVAPKILQLKDDKKTLIDLVSKIGKIERNVEWRTG